jgi:N-acyl-D-aspartate/D-glutamate deacylase
MVDLVLRKGKIIDGSGNCWFAGDIGIRGGRIRKIGRIEEDAKRILEKNQKTGAIVLECTDLPAFAKAIQKVTNLPVFDIVALVRMVHEAFLRKG